MSETLLNFLDRNSLDIPPPLDALPLKMPETPPQPKLIPEVSNHPNAHDTGPRKASIPPHQTVSPPVVASAVAAEDFGPIPVEPSGK